MRIIVVIFANNVLLLVVDGQSLVGYLDAKGARW
jgi:hypothetical protein